MKFTFNEKKLKVGPELRAYAEKKIGKLEKYFHSETDASVTFSEERGRFRAEVTLRNNGLLFRGSELSSEMASSIDAACAAIERQIRKNKTRLEKRLRSGSLSQMEAILPGDNAPEEAEEAFDIIRTKRFSIKPMTPEEAILQMELLEHEFFAFKNQDDSDTFSVVYRRKNGGYGLISDTDSD